MAGHHELQIELRRLPTTADLVEPKSDSQGRAGRHSRAGQRSGHSRGGGKGGCVQVTEEKPASAKMCRTLCSLANENGPDPLALLQTGAEHACTLPAALPSSMGSCAARASMRTPGGHLFVAPCACWQTRAPGREEHDAYRSGP